MDGEYAVNEAGLEQSKGCASLVQGELGHMTIMIRLMLNLFGKS